MKDYIKLLLLMCIPFSGFSTPQINGDYWKCISRDNTNKEWSSQNTYKKAAITWALSLCKKESQHPEACNTSDNDCEGFNQGLSTRPLWRCTALDQKATFWKSEFQSNREDAALAAKAFCKSKSSIPDTCYVNLAGCDNLNMGH